MESGQRGDEPGSDARGSGDDGEGRSPARCRAEDARRLAACVIVEDPVWRRMVPGLERKVARAAAAAGGAGSVLLTNDGAVRRLNREFRGRDKPTNVLTFEGGDIALAAGVVRREARAARRRVEHHLMHLVVHGALHLQGEDHHGPGEARRMEMREAVLLHRLGVPNPWRVA